ncbi:MAG TPA: branched-chain amino acid ABC transporter permease [Nocardioidaceae bacterium]|jgi:branched-chain amino acid transport system permease protein|nr:branched-chain amino acid ABC transporter permease [Nocardioidaceae bacterium]
MTLFIQTVVNGLLVGGLFVTISIGFSLAFGVLDVVDFAVGEWVMLGAFAGVASTTWFGIDPIAFLPVVFVFFALLGWLLSPLIYRVRTSHYARPALMALAFTFGIATLARGSMLTAVGFDPRTVDIGVVNGTVTIGSLHIPALRLLGFAFAAVATALFMLFLYRTRTGLAARAVAQDKEYAGLMGVNVKRVSSLVYALYAGLTAMAGVLIGGIYSITAQDGPLYTLLAFFVVVLGGLGSVGGALVAGLLLGLLEALVTVYVSADYTLAVVFGVLFLVLVISPRGLLRRGLA